MNMTKKEINIAYDVICKRIKSCVLKVMEKHLDEDVKFFKYYKTIEIHVYDTIRSLLTENNKYIEIGNFRNVDLRPIRKTDVVSILLEITRYHSIKLEGLDFILNKGETLESLLIEHDLMTK